MKAIVIGCGRVGSNLALELDRAGWDVTAIDRRESALNRVATRPHTTEAGHPEEMRRWK